MNDQVCLPLAHISAAAKLVPANKRPHFFATLLMGSSDIDFVDADPPASIAEGDDEPVSYSLTTQQARALKDKN